MNLDPTRSEEEWRVRLREAACGAWGAERAEAIEAAIERMATALAHVSQARLPLEQPPYWPAPGREREPRGAV